MLYSTSQIKSAKNVFAISRPLIGQLSPFSISHWLKQQIQTTLMGGIVIDIWEKTFGSVRREIGHG